MTGDVLATIPIGDMPVVALLRLDTDWYESTRHELTHLYPRLSKSGILIIDDYGHWKGCRKAVDEYFAGQPLFLFRVDYTRQDRRAPMSDRRDQALTDGHQRPRRRFLLYAKSAGVDFGDMAMIGRQSLYVTPSEMRQVFAAAGETLTDAEIADICNGSAGYAETFFSRLGARRAESADYSNFESATFTHDMNAPIPPRHHEQYSVVLDSGSLEHIFNFPCAIKNCMEMVRLGGHFVSITPANNFFGHGFYQFSPELYFTVLSAENGFEMQTMMAFEETKHAIWYGVRSPKEVRERVTLLNAEPVYLCMIAQRTAMKPIFERTPQQSDYVARWTPGASYLTADVAAVPSAKRPLPIRLAKTVLPFGVRQSIRKALARPSPPSVKPGFDPKFFRRIGPAPGLRATADED